MPTDKDRECLLAAQHALERAEVISGSIPRLATAAPRIGVRLTN